MLCGSDVNFDIDTQTGDFVLSDRTLKIFVFLEYVFLIISIIHIIVSFFDNGLVRAKEHLISVWDFFKCKIANDGTPSNEILCDAILKLIYFILFSIIYPILFIVIICLIFIFRHSKISCLIFEKRSYVTKVFCLIFEKWGYAMILHGLLVLIPWGALYLNPVKLFVWCPIYWILRLSRFIFDEDKKDKNKKDKNNDEDKNNNNVGFKSENTKDNNKSEVIKQQ